MVGHAPFRFERGRSTRSSHHDDLVLAGDNAIVIGLAAAGLPLQQRTNAVLVGIIACDGPTDNIRLNHHPAVAGGGASACGGHSPALGELESVS
jgi:hypothetical protein